MQLGMESKLKVTATARHFFHDPSIRGLFQKHGVQLQETAYGGELDDSRIDSVEMLQIANGSDALIIGKAPISREVISGMPRLKIISVRGVGYDGIDLGAAAEKGVVLTITPGAVDDAVAEYTIGLIIALARGLARADAEMRDGLWSVKVGSELHDRTLGLVGFGGIGRGVAKRASLGLGMRVLVHTRHPDLQAGDVEFSDLEPLISRADFVSLHVPLNEETRGLIGPRELGLMKSSAYLINTARGAIVDEAALHEALSNGRIAGAALDVFEHEPLQRGPFLNLDNVILSPHMAGYTNEGIIKSNRAAALNALSILRGEPTEPSVTVSGDRT